MKNINIFSHSFLFFLVLFTSTSIFAQQKLDGAVFVFNKALGTDHCPPRSGSKSAHYTYLRGSGECNQEEASFWDETVFAVNSLCFVEVAQPMLTTNVCKVKNVDNPIGGPYRKDPRWDKKRFSVKFVESSCPVVHCFLADLNPSTTDEYTFDVKALQAIFGADVSVKR